MSRDRVDILLPVFNGALTIEAAVDSLRAQTVAELRVIIVDDGSTDETPRLIAAMARRDKRIVILTKPNGGIVEALNLGLSRCEGTFVARQDADDVSDPGRLEAQIDYLARHQDCVAVSGAVRHVDGAGRSLGTIQRFAAPEGADPHWAPSREPYLSHPFLMVRRPAIHSLGGYRHVHNSEDTDLYWRLGACGRLHNLAAPLGSYRMHQGSISGGSIVGGRIMALSSQLAGLSALRRRANRADLSFVKEAVAEYRAASTLGKIYQLGCRQLDDAEAGYLRIAASGKLLELTAYRPFELECDDCAFIREARGEMGRLSPANRAELDALYAAAAARLLRKGLGREAALLAPPSLYASVAGRVAATMLPGSWSHRIARMRRRERAAPEDAAGDLAL